MARPGQLAELIAKVFGLEITTVREQARVLRKAGLMSLEKAGRGPGTMTPRDAVHLILAAAGTGSTTKSTRPVELHGQCMNQNGSWKIIDLPLVKQLTPDHRFVELLEALLRSAMQADGSSDQWVHTSTQTGQSSELYVSITIEEPGPSARVEVGRSWVDESGSLNQEMLETNVYKQRLFPGSDMLAEPAFLPHEEYLAKLQHTHRFDEAIFLEVARLLKEGTE